jgi:hypothetical protein
MRKLINQLQQDRILIQDRFQQVTRLGVHTMQGRNMLMESRYFFLRHLSKEDLDFCQKLKTYFRNDPLVLEVVESFEAGTKKLIAFSSNFFRKYTIFGGGIEFIDDYNRLKASFEHQLKREHYFLRNQEEIHLAKAS